MTVPAPLVRRLAVVGAGLIGGSLCLAARSRGLAQRVAVIERDAAALAEASRRGLAHEASADPGAARGADLVVLAVPVGAMGEAAAAVAPHLAEGTVVTDVGSVKGAVLAAVVPALPFPARFVPGHPIAGRERSGAAAADADLFEGALVVLTPEPRTDPACATAVRALWAGAGGRVLTMDAAEHDRVFAAVSHLPHVVAYALVGALLDLEADQGPLVRFSAGGLRDFTRIAQSDPIMWRDICLANREPLLKSLARFRHVLGALEAQIAAGDAAGLLQALARAREARRGMSS
jgi:cyclohexadieny/prephenate dehydrogenase